MDVQRTPNELELEETTDSHEQAAAMRAGGYTYREIAAELGVSHVTVFQWLNGRKGQEKVRNYVAAAGEAVLMGIIANMSKALRVQSRVLDGDEGVSNRQANTANQLVVTFTSRMADIQVYDDE